MSRLLLPALILALAGLSPAAPDLPDLPREPVSPRTITATADQDDYWPCFSPDGTRVFFSRRFPGKPWQLYQVPVAGGEAVPLFIPSPSRGATRASRSGNGRLAFLGDGDLWITAPELRQPERQLIQGLAGGPSYPSWYPDDRHLLIVAYRGNKAGGSLYRVDTSTGQASALTDFSKVRAGMAHISPDGRDIVFAGQPAAGVNYDQERNSIWILRREEDPRPLTGHQGRAPTWSPSGRWIAYESRHGGPDRRQAIFIVSPDGRTDQRITSYEINANHPVWSPDGSSLAISMATPDRPGRTCIAIIRLVDGK